MQPETRYATSDGLSVAYKVVGTGPRDLVLMSPFWGQIEHLWELPSCERFLRRLASFSRLIMFDKRGSGLSDRVSGTPSAEDRMDDIRAVMEAVGSSRATLFGMSEGGTLCALFAATYPERIDSLVIYAGAARFTPAADYPWGLTKATIAALDEYSRTRWGSGGMLGTIAPAVAADEGLRRWFGQLERLTGPPSAVRDLLRWNMEIDVRDVLSTIRAPTLVIHRTGDPTLEIGHGRYLAEHIPGARLLELPGDEHYPYIRDTEPVISAVEEFVTGELRLADHDRVLATVLFTDIVGSTERAAALGDRQWRDLLERHHLLVRRELGHFGGREVKTVGDGFLATFDGPARAVRCACAIREGVQTLGVSMTAGIHTGECELLDADIGGIAVHIAARVEAEAEPGEVLVSSTVKDLVVGSGIAFADRGSRALKGLPGEWRLFKVDGV